MSSANDASDRLIARGNEAEKDGKLVEACELYRKAVQAAPGYAKAHLNLGIGLEATGNVDGAMGQYEAALVIDAADIYANYNFAKLLYAPNNAAATARVIKLSGTHHKRIAKAIRSGDVVGASAAIARHLDAVEERLLSQLM